MSRAPRSSSEAVQRYRHALQLALSCLSPTAQWRRSGQGPDVVLMSNPRDVPLKTPQGLLYLNAGQRLQVGRDLEVPRATWQLTAQWYGYTISAAPGLTGEVFGWHWHPASTVQPHLHVHAAGRLPDLHKLHLPTAHVPFPEVVHFLLMDLRTRAGRPDWPTQLERSLAAV